MIAENSAIGILSFTGKDIAYGIMRYQTRRATRAKSLTAQIKSQSIFCTVFTCATLASVGISRRRVSVCLCVSLYCVETAKQRITQRTRRDSPETLVVGRQRRWLATPIPPEICAQSDPHPLSNTTISTNIRS